MHMERDITQEYYAQLDKFNLLAEEVVYILKKGFKKNDVNISNITSRIKTLNSFLDKIHRKGYKKPFLENTDFVGVRIVYIYRDEFDIIDRFINQEFNVIEEYNKNKDLGYDRFGYDAIHYLIKIHPDYKGARYEEIKDVVCEIQVRTILQDAWALVSHHLEYKQENEIPDEFKRKLNALAGTFETIDTQLIHIKKEKLEYIEEIRKDLSHSHLQMRINLDNLREYLMNKFPKLPLETSKDVINIFPEMLKRYKYITIQDLDNLLEKTISARIAFNREESFGKSAVRELFIALGLVNPEAEVEFTILNDRYLLDKFRSFVD